MIVYFFLYTVCLSVCNALCLQIKDRFELTVVIVFDNSKDSPDTAQVANVVIIITDVNDNAPLFTRKLIPMVNI